MYLVAFTMKHNTYTLTYCILAIQYNNNGLNRLCDSTTVRF